MPEIQVLTPDDWPAWRELRLAALAESPRQFGSRLADWQGAGDQPERWRARLEIPGSLNLIAIHDGQPAGMVCGIPGPADGVIQLISLWAARPPAARAPGAGSSTRSSRGLRAAAPASCDCRSGRTTPRRSGCMSAAGSAGPGRPTAAPGTGCRSW